MNPKKRKAEEDGDKCEGKDELTKDIKNESSDVLLNCENSECENSTGAQKSNNGGQPGTTRDIICLDEDSIDKTNSSTEQPDTKLFRLDSPQTSGTLLFCGGTNWDLIGRRELPKNAKGASGKSLWGPHRIASLQGIKVSKVCSGSCAVHSVIITDSGTPYTWGRNDKHQLGLGDSKRRDIPTVVETLKDHHIISAACGRAHTLFLSERGILYAAGDNKFGQCGVGSQNNTVNIPTKVPFKERSVSKAACGAEFSVILDTNGGMYSFGCPEYGQLGHNSDGKYFVTSSKMSFSCEVLPRRITTFIEKTKEGHVSRIDDVRIIDVACGINHTVASDSKKRCYSYGFGGYGRLGHCTPSDEMIPRLIKVFDGINRGVKKIYAGGTYSLAINEYDVLYFFGMSKRTGEANMYPKPVTDLVGWQVRDVGCGNTSIVCVAEESVISWGPSPTYGELGYGENRPKSSTSPTEVKSLDGIHIEAVACGYGHTLFIARDESEEDKKKLNKLPKYTP